MSRHDVKTCVCDETLTNITSSSAGDVMKSLKYLLGNGPFVVDRHHLTNVGGERWKLVGKSTTETKRLLITAGVGKFSDTEGHKGF